LTPGRWTFLAMVDRRRMRDDRAVMNALTDVPATGADATRSDRRFRVAERRDLREAVRLGAMIGAVVLALDLAMNGADSPTLAIVNTIGIAALVLLFTRRARRYPQIAGFAVVVTLLWASILPELVAQAHVALLPGYLALIIVASAVFLPWSPRWHVAWLVVASAVGLAAGVMTSATTEAAIEFGVLILAAAATSAAGNTLILRRRERVHLQQVALHEQRTELRRLSAQLREVASRDSLTGLGNRRRLTEDIADFEARLAREVLPGVAAIMIDLDHFKTYNDRAGHPAGDEVLRVVSGAIRGAVREIDRVYRYGGEEVLVLLEEPTGDGAMLAAHRILDAVRRLALPHVAQPGHAVTVSAGAAAQAGPGVTVWHVIEAADQALYEAKRAGRDRAVLARPLPPAAAREPHARHDADDDDEDVDPGINPGPSPRVRLTG
jgi:diguanylate cyclase (GGDEF)-like protein